MKTLSVSMVRSCSRLVLILLLLVSTTGCFRYKLVYASASKNPKAVDGMLQIATNKKIRVSVGGTDVVAKKDLGGFIAMHKDEARAFVENTIELQKLKKKK